MLSLLYVDSQRWRTDQIGRERMQGDEGGWLGGRGGKEERDEGIEEGENEGIS